MCWWNQDKIYQTKMHCISSFSIYTLELSVWPMSNFSCSLQEGRSRKACCSLTNVHLESVSCISTEVHVSSWWYRWWLKHQKDWQNSTSPSCSASSCRLLLTCRKSRSSAVSFFLSFNFFYLFLWILSSSPCYTYIFLRQHLVKLRQTKNLKLCGEQAV